MNVAARLRRVIAGKYAIDTFLGAGGMGLVYAATHRATLECVAIKFLRQELASDPAYRRRFLREAQISANLKHPNVTRVIDFEEDAEFGPFMVLELLRGESLEETLARQGRLDPREAAAMLLPVMHALDHAHGRGVLHRDLKPANLFVHRESDDTIIPKLLDFGLVRVMGDAGGFDTRTGQVIGTPSHMSPEQARGDKDLTPASDVWSMAVTLYACLSGQEPFERGTPEATILAVVNGEYVPLDQRCPQLPEVQALEALIARALQVDPTKRTGQMRTLMVEFAQATGVELGSFLMQRGLRHDGVTPTRAHAGASEPRPMVPGTVAAPTVPPAPPAAPTAAAPASPPAARPRWLWPALAFAMLSAAFLAWLLVLSVPASAPVPMPPRLSTESGAPVQSAPPSPPKPPPPAQASEPERPVPSRTSRPKRPDDLDIGEVLVAPPKAPRF